LKVCASVWEAVELLILKACASVCVCVFCSWFFVFVCVRVPFQKIIFNLARVVNNGVYQFLMLRVFSVVENTRQH